jgi:hypothetical protein
MNFALTLLPLPLNTQMGLIILGFSLPLALSLKIVPGEKKPSGGDGFKSIPFWVWVLLAGGAVVVRFYQLTSLSLWPLEDEAMSSHYALELARFGHWQWTYDFSGLPPLYIWLLAGVYKVFPISLATLWFPPALFSFLGLFLLWRGARRLFSPAFALVFTLLGAFSFWPLYLARFSVEGGFMVAWECLAFERWSAFHRAGEKEKPFQALTLGVAAGIGFFTFQAWPVVACLLTLAVFQETLFQGWRKGKVFLLFFIPQFLLFILLASQSLPDRAGHYAYAFCNPFGPGWPGLNDLFALFWGSRLPLNYFAYRPWGGGFLNPVLATFFFWGFLELFRRREWRKLLAGLGVLIWLVLPGLVTGGADAHRIAQVCPFLLFFAAFGLVQWIRGLPSSWRIGVLAGVLLVSSAWDFSRLFGEYHSLWTHPKDNWFASKSVERMRAFQILEPLAKAQGPGFVISELVPDLFDQSLSDLAFPFNACENPAIPPGKAKWAALLINENYGEFLKKVFPDARWFPLAPDVERPNGGLMLGLLPLPGSNPAELNRLVLADVASCQLVDLTFDHHDWKPRGPILKGLFDRYRGNFQGDPFLEACFFEKVAEQEYGDRDLQGQSQALRLAVEKGLPAAHLFNDLGALYLRSQKYGEAKKCFERALQSPGGRTSARAGLEALEVMEKSGKPPAGIP